jgi:hypothetical protein
MKPGDTVYRAITYRLSQRTPPEHNHLSVASSLAKTITDVIIKRVKNTSSHHGQPSVLWEGTIASIDNNIVRISWNKKIGFWSNSRFPSLLTAFQTLLRRAEHE